MSTSVRAFPETLRTLAFGSFGGGYTKVGSVFGHPIRLIKFLNTTDVLVTVSFDGTNDHDIVPSNGFALYDVSSNRSATSDEWSFAQGTQIYAKGAPTLGSFYVVTFYGQS